VSGHIHTQVDTFTHKWAHSHTSRSTTGNGVTNTHPVAAWVGPIEVREFFYKTKHSWEVLGYRNEADEILILLGCDFASLGD